MIPICDFQRREDYYGDADNIVYNEWKNNESPTVLLQVKLWRVYRLIKNLSYTTDMRNSPFKQLLYKMK